MNIYQVIRNLEGLGVLRIANQQYWLSNVSTDTEAVEGLKNTDDSTLTDTRPLLQGLPKQKPTLKHNSAIIYRLIKII